MSLSSLGDVTLDIWILGFGDEEGTDEGTGINMAFSWLGCRLVAKEKRNNDSK